MKRYAFFMMLSLFVFSCTESTTVDVSEEQTELVANETATFSVSGMVCKMGCGGSIKKALLATNKVTKVDVSFEEDQPENEISVHFNNTLLSTDDILAIIQELNDGQFSATLQSTSPVQTSLRLKESGNQSTKKSDLPVLEAKEKFFTFPNLTEFLNGLIY